MIHEEKYLTPWGFLKIGWKQKIEKKVLDEETATKLRGKRDHDASIPQNASKKQKPTSY